MNWTEILLMIRLARNEQFSSGGRARTGLVSLFCGLDGDRGSLSLSRVFPLGNRKSVIRLRQLSTVALKHRNPKQIGYPSVISIDIFQVLKRK